MAAQLTCHVYLILVILLSAFLVESAQDQSPLKIAAFNIQNLRTSKLNKPGIAGNLTNIILRYDLIFIQEILQEDAIFELFMKVQAASGNAYSIETSTQHGTAPSHMEAYAYIYRSNKFSAVEVYEWTGREFAYPLSPSGREFAYPPFSIRAKPSNPQIPEFGLIGVHIRPSRGRDRITSREINSLPGVHTYLNSRWRTLAGNFIFAGDMNAGCAFLNGQERRTLVLSSSSYRWLIPDDAKTNVATGKDCPYDRIIVTGNNLINAVGNSGVFRFDLEFQLKNAQAGQVSDHFPVYVELKPSPSSFWSTLRSKFM